MASHIHRIIHAAVPAIVLGCITACGGPRGAKGPAAPPASAQSTKDAPRHFARNFWYEIATEHHTGHAWMIPQCEPAGERTGIEFKPSQPGAREYGPAAPRPRSSLAVALAGAVARAARARGQAVPQADARLDMAAEELAQLVPRSGRLPVRLVDFVVSRRGVVAPSPLVLVLWGPIFDLDAMVAQLEPELPDILDHGQWNRLGIGSVERRDLGEGVVVLAFHTSHVELQPLPRAVARGQSFEIAGTVASPYTNPRISVVHDLGDRSLVHEQNRGEREFRAVASCGDYQGARHIEIEARLGQATELVARFPVWCAEPPPDSIVVDTENPVLARAAVSSGNAAVYIAALINHARERCGLPSLHLDPRLSNIARDHALHIMKTGKPFDEWPAGQSPVERTRATLGLVTEIYRYFARSYELYDVQRELLHSFGYRAAILSPGITHMGVAVETRGSKSNPELFMTQLFAGVPDAVDADQVRALVTAKLHHERRFTVDSDLERAARRAAAALANGTPVNDVVDATIHDLRRRKTEFKDCRLHVWNGADVTDFQPGDVLLEDKYRYHGVGVARNEPAPGREAAFHIVVVVAEKPAG